MMLNSAVAESLRIYADRLEKAEDFEQALHEMIKKTIHDHKRIIFNGNGYDAAWVKEATEVRKLLNYPTTPDCMPHLLDEKNVKMLTSHKVFNEAELHSRCEIMLDNYCKQVWIEVNTELLMARRMILPAIESYADKLSGTVAKKRAVNETLQCGYEKSIVEILSSIADQIYQKAEELEQTAENINGTEDIIKESQLIRDQILPKMQELRSLADKAETYVSREYWPLPSYGELLFSVK
jgi:glutamine synthetase